jgi:hypothetical protein
MRLTLLYCKQMTDSVQVVSASSTLHWTLPLATIASQTTSMLLLSRSRRVRAVLLSASAGAQQLHMQVHGHYLLALSGCCLLHHTFLSSAICLFRALNSFLT